MLRRNLRLLGLGAFAAFVFACNLLNVIAPYRAPPQPVSVASGWIGGEIPARRGFFRQVIDVRFLPRHAWIGVATDDFILYVNGQRAAQNQAAANAGMPFQHGRSDKQQGLNDVTTLQSRAPDMRVATNREWRAIAYTDISGMIVPGANVIAIAVQTADPAVRLSVTGRIDGESVSIPIDGAATAWRQSGTPDRIGGQLWSLARATEDGWRRAAFLGPLEAPLHATAPPGAWERAVPRTGLSGPELSGEVRLARLLPGLDDPAQAAWLRINSAWPYDLMVGATLAGAGGTGGNPEVFDVSRHLRDGPQRVSLRLHRAGHGSPDQPVAAIDGAVGDARIAPDDGWVALQAEDLAWVEGGGVWASAFVTPMEYGRRMTSFESVPPLGAWAARVALTWGACLGIAIVLFRALAGLGGFAGDRTRGRAAALWILSVPGFVGVAAYLLRLRFKETDLILDYLDTSLYLRALLLAAAVLVLALAAFLGIASRESARVRVPGFASVTGALPPQWRARIVVLAIVVAGFGLRAYVAGLENLQADENVSLDASRGILRSGGAPYETSGILYTRSAFYHYLLAAWTYALGSTPVAGRLMSAVPGALVIFICYEIGYLATGRRYIGLLCALLAALNPWQIQQSINLRFYQQMQFFGLLATYCFLRGFITGRSKSAQNLFFVFASLSILSQEIFVLAFPGLCIAGFLYYRPFRWGENVNVLIGFVTMMSVAVIDAGIFTLLCLTRNVGITTTIGPIIQLHVLNPFRYLNTFFLQELRGNFMAGVVFLAALPFWILRRNAVILSLYIVIVSAVITAAVLVMQITARYVFILNPLLITIYVASGDAAIRFIAYRLSRPLRRNPLRYQQVWMAMAWPVFAATVAIDLRTGALARSFDQHLIMEHETAYRYIAAHRQPGDQVISASPMAGAIVLGGIDYYLVQQIQFDELYMTPPGIVDRWAGGKVLSKIDKLREVLSRNERAWIIMDQAEAFKFTPNFLAYLYAVTTVKLEFLGGDLLLWEAAAGRNAQTFNQGGAIDDF